MELGVLSEEEAQQCVSVEFNPVRVAFHGGAAAGGKGNSKAGDSGGAELWTRDVLNLGVSPARLVEAARRRFKAAGGRVLERTALAGMAVHPDGVALQLGGGSGGGSGAGSSPRQLTARLVLDAMGHASPVVQQVRWGRKPDGVCLVVGSCCRGFDPAANTTGDIILTNSHSQPPPGTSSSGSSSGTSGSAVTNAQCEPRCSAHAALAWCCGPGRCSCASSTPSAPDLFPARLLGGVPCWQWWRGPHHLHVHLWVALGSHRPCICDAFGGAARRWAARRRRWPRLESPCPLGTLLPPAPCPPPDLDAHPDRPSLEALLEDYWRLMPPYQGLPDAQGLQVRRRPCILSRQRSAAGGS